MGPRYLVDGYNLMHCFRDLGRLAGHDVELARDRLVSRLAGFRAGKRIRVRVVFDGRPATVPAPADRTLGVEVEFAGATSADERIVGIVRRARHPGAWTVVSSDRWVKENARAHGARTVNSGQFAELVLATRTGGTAPGPEKPEMRPADVKEWEEYFRGGRAEEGA